MYAQVEKPKENRNRAVASEVSHKKCDGGHTFQFVDNHTDTATQRKLQVLANKDLKHISVIQGYFTDNRKKHLFGGFLRADKETIEKVQQYLKRNNPEQIETFNRINSDNSPNGGVCLQDWLESIGTSIEMIDLWLIKEEFPQTKDIPDTWITDTHAFNQGGPPIVVRPEDVPPPTDSQMEEDGVKEEEIQPTDLVTDISRDTFTYWRNLMSYPITDQNRSEIRSGSMLTNAVVDIKSAQGQPLIGTNTEEIKAKTSALRQKERERKEKTGDYEGQILSHHPDTFWTAKSYSDMGWHPVNKTTNTLEGDSHNLSSLTGQQLSGMVVREKDDRLWRPTLGGYNEHKERHEIASEMIKAIERINSFDFEEFKRIMIVTKSIIVTVKTQYNYDMMANVLDKLDEVYSEDGNVSEKIELYLSDYPKYSSNAAADMVLVAIKRKLLTL